MDKLQKYISNSHIRSMKNANLRPKSMNTKIFTYVVLENAYTHNRTVRVADATKMAAVLAPECQIAWSFAT